MVACGLQDRYLAIYSSISMTNYQNYSNGFSTYCLVLCLVPTEVQYIIVEVCGRGNMFTSYLGLEMKYRGGLGGLNMTFKGVTSKA